MILGIQASGFKTVMALEKNPFAVKVSFILTTASLQETLNPSSQPVAAYHFPLKLVQFTMFMGCFPAMAMMLQKSFPNKFMINKPVTATYEMVIDWYTAGEASKLPQSRQKWLQHPLLYPQCQQLWQPIK